MNKKNNILLSWLVKKSASVSKVSMMFELLDNALNLFVGIDTRILLVVKMISWTLKIGEEICKALPYFVYLASKKRNLDEN